MADTKITALAAITTVDPAADVLPIVDVSDTSMAASGTTKKITSNQILGAGGTATLASATITGDLTVDTSTLKVDSTNNRVGINQASPSHPFQIGTNDFIVNSVGNASIGDTAFAGTRLTLKESASQPNALAMTNRNATQTWRIGVDVSAVDDKILGFYDSTSTAFRMQLTDTGNLGLGGAPTATTKFVCFNGVTQAMTLTSGGDLLVGTTSAAGSASNSKILAGGVFQTVGGSTASTASGVAVTAFTAANEATYIVSAYISGTGTPASYNAVAIVKVSGGTATVTTISSATNLSISVSGSNVQLTQTSGAAQVMSYNAIRIS